MLLFNIFILGIYVPDGTGSLEKFQESNTGMKGRFGEEKTPSLLFAFHVFISVPRIEMQTGHRGGAWPQFHQFSLGNMGNLGAAECRAGSVPWGLSLGGSCWGCSLLGFSREFHVSVCVSVLALGFFSLFV